MLFMVQLFYRFEILNPLGCWVWKLSSTKYSTYLSIKICTLAYKCFNPLSTNDAYIMSSHKPIRIYMGDLILGDNTLYRLFCFFKLFPMVGKGLTRTTTSATTHPMVYVFLVIVLTFEPYLIFVKFQLPTLSTYQFVNSHSSMLTNWEATCS